jgi:replicative DNA helicase
MKKINLEAEIISVLVDFNDNNQTPEIIEVLNYITPFDFEDNNNSTAISIIKDLWQKGKTINKMEVLNEYKKTYGDENSITFWKSINNLVFNVPNILEKFLILREKFVDKKIKEIEIKRHLRQKDNIDVFAEIQQQEDELLKIKKLLFFKEKEKNLKDIIIKNIENAYKKQTKDTYKTLLSDKLKIEKGDLVILGARPGMGKTAFALFMAREFLKRDLKVMFFSLEMTFEKLLLRIQCGESEVPLYNYRYNSMTDEQLTNFKNASENIMSWNLKINDNLVKINDIKTKCLIEKQKGLDVIFIDYLGLIHCQNKDTKNNELSALSVELKRMAKELEVPIVLLHQLNRELEKRGNKRPILSDLRDSGAIEQDADIVLFVYREDYYLDKNSPKNNTTEILIAKYREGEANKIIELENNNDLTNFKTNNIF